MTLYQLARTLRSKNAGPFTLTIDLMFDSTATYHQGLRCLTARREEIAALYGTDIRHVAIHPFEDIRTVKVTLPRPVMSGGRADRDVYGSQQHFPLAGLEV